MKRPATPRLLKEERVLAKHRPSIMERLTSTVMIKELPHETGEDPFVILNRRLVEDNLNNNGER